MPRNKYPELTREIVIDAGLAAFQEKGYEASTILDIVGKMKGLSRGAFYHHFKSKEEVLFAVCERIFEKNNPFTKVRDDKNLNGLEKLRKALKINMSLQQKDFAILDDVSIELLKSPHFFMWQSEFNVSTCRKSIQPLIEEGIADGSIKNQDPKILAELFCVMFGFWLGSVLFAGDSEYMEQKAHVVFAILDSFGLELYDEEIEILGGDWLKDNSVTP